MRQIIKAGEQENLGLAVQRLIEQNLTYLNTSYLARVEKINDDNTIDISPCVGESYIIGGIRVGVLSGAAFSFNPVLRVGDLGLAVVNSVDITAFSKDNSKGAPRNSDRLFDMQDSIFLPLAFDFKKAEDTEINIDSKLALTATKDTTFSSGGKLVLECKDKVKINNQASSLKDLLDELIDTLSSLTTTNAVNGAPCSLNPATIQKLITLKTKVGGLFE